MTKRYGRNQRRAHRDRIAELENEVLKTYRHWGMCTDATIPEIDLQYVRQISIREDRVAYRIEREVTFELGSDYANDLTKITSTSTRGQFLRHEGYKLMVMDYQLAGGGRFESYMERIDRFSIALTMQTVQGDKFAKEFMKGR